MNVKLLPTITIFALILSCATVVNFAFANPPTPRTLDYNASGTETNKNYSDVDASPKWSFMDPDTPETKPLFLISAHYDNNGKPTSLSMHLKPELAGLYEDLSTSEDDKVAFVYPIFTQAAYGNHGFYDYYRKQCDSSCLTVKIPNKIAGGYASSMASAYALKLLNYSHITDVDIDKNPDILKKYDWIILLHNEYVTKKEFDAITHHPYVTYLYPNALYAEVKTNYTDNTFTLVKGHGYPDSSIRNGFGWKYDNSKFEYDTKCKNWNYTEINNGVMLNCYPEFKIVYDEYMLRSLQQEDPKSIHDDVYAWTIHNQTISDQDILYDFAYSATHMPTWMKKTGTIFARGDIDQHDFGLAIDYLYNKDIIQRVADEFLYSDPVNSTDNHGEQTSYS